MQIEQILARKGYAVHTVLPDSNLADASRLLIEKDIGVLVCTDQTGGIVGILSERDLARALGRHGAEAAGLRVSDVMTRDVVACAVSDTVEYLLTIMTETRCRHIPVVREGKLIGLVSIGDLVKAHLV
ncbi:CBS domain [Candidatus Terasakiella magnetica]|nr:CBS domain [Candidatus Terasakiella magnetica]